MEEVFVEYQNIKDIDYSKEALHIGEYEGCNFINCDFSNSNISNCIFVDCVVCICEYFRIIEFMCIID